MRFNILTIRGLFCLALNVFVNQAAIAVTLQEAFAAAVKVSGSVQSADLATEKARIEQDAFRGALFPNLTADGVSRLAENGGFTGDTQRHTLSIGVKQPLFQGGREYVGSRLAEQNIRVSEASQSEQRWLLLSTLIDSYFRVVALERDSANLRKQIDVIEEQVAELKERVAIGRSTASALTTQLSQLARIRANLARDEADLLSARHQFSYLTDLPIDAKLQPPPLEESLAAKPAEKNHSDPLPPLKTLREREDVQDSLIELERKAYFPEVSAEANYHLIQEGIASPSQWDVAIRLSLDLPTGNVISHRVRGASKEAQIVRSQRLDIERRLAAERDGLESEVQQRRETLSLLEEARTLAKKAVDQQRKDFEQGLISHLDLMRAMDEHLEARRGYDRAAVELMRVDYQMKRMQGWMP